MQFAQECDDGTTPEWVRSALFTSMIASSLCEWRAIRTTVSRQLLAQNSIIIVKTSFDISKKNSWNKFFRLWSRCGLRSTATSKKKKVSFNEVLQEIDDCTPLTRFAASQTLTVCGEREQNRGLWSVLCCMPSCQSITSILLFTFDLPIPVLPPTKCKTAPALSLPLLGSAPLFDRQPVLVQLSQQTIRPVPGVVDPTTHGEHCSVLLDSRPGSPRPANILTLLWVTVSPSGAPLVAGGGRERLAQMVNPTVADRQFQTRSEAVRSAIASRGQTRLTTTQIVRQHPPLGPHTLFSGNAQCRSAAATQVDRKSRGETNGDESPGNGD